MQESVLAPEVMADLIRTVNAPDFGAWESRVHRLGGCSNPRHVKGFTRVRDDSGRVVSEFSSAGEPGGVVLVACRNRRATRCPSCARLYGGDVFGLTLAGMAGGKGVPASIATHPRIFATFTAPGFGAVHTIRDNAENAASGESGRALLCHPRRGGRCEHGRVVGCFEVHRDGDPVLGAPLCVDCYDYRGAVVWQASVGALWARFTIYLPRHPAAAAGLKQREVKDTVRLSYVKIAEFQRRGLVHLHAIIRGDGRSADEDPKVFGVTEDVPPPGWLTTTLMDQAVREAAAAVTVPIRLAAGEEWRVRFGEQLDVRAIRQAGPEVGQEEDAKRLAAYVAKYATKSTETTGWDHRGPDGSPRSAHAVRMVETARRLALEPELSHLRLHRVAKQLGYRGHVSSKSRRYSTTLTAIRAERVRYVADKHSGGNNGKDPGRQEDGADVSEVAGEVGTGRTGGIGGTGTDAELVRESRWRVTGHGYTPGEAVIAGQIARDKELNDEAARAAGPLGAVRRERWSP